MGQMILSIVVQVVLYIDPMNFFINVPMTYFANDLSNFSCGGFLVGARKVKVKKQKLEGELHPFFLNTEFKL